MRPVRVEPSMLLAPSRPTSSAMVMSISRGPCATAGVLGDGHHGDDGDAVIGAQGGAVGREPLAVADELDAPLGRVVRAVRTALADHIEVTLEDHDGRRLSAGRRRHAHDQVRASGRHDLEPLLGGPRLDVRHGCFLVT